METLRFHWHSWGDLLPVASCSILFLTRDQIAVRSVQGIGTGTYQVYTCSSTCCTYSYIFLLSNCSKSTRKISSLRVACRSSSSGLFTLAVLPLPLLSPSIFFSVVSFSLAHSLAVATVTEEGRRKEGRQSAGSSVSSSKQQRQRRQRQRRQRR